MEQRRLRVLEVITNAQNVAELIALDLEIADYINIPQQADLLFLMVQSRDSKEDTSREESREKNWLDGMARSLEVFWEASKAINKRLFELVPDSDTLTSVLQKIHDEEIRRRLLWRWDHYHESFQADQSE